MATFRKKGSKWEARLSYNDSEGIRKQKSKMFATKREANKWVYETELFLKPGMDKSDQTVLAYFDNWYKIYKQPHITDRTLRHYRESSKIIEKYFQGMKLTDLNDENIQKFINAFGEGTPPFDKPHAWETVSKLLTHFKGALKKATKEGIFRTNPAEDTKVTFKVEPRSERSKYLNEDDQIKLRQYIIEHMTPDVSSYYLILTGLDTGMRPGELLGLTWNHINFKKNIIEVVRTWNYVDNTFGPVKGGKPRNITVNPALLDILKNIEKFKKSDFVFGTADGRPMSTDNLSKMLRKIQKRAGIEHTVNPHGLRHSHASLLLYHGMNVKALQKRLGHKDIQTTLNTYSHVMDEMDVQQNEIMNETFKNIYNNIEENE